MVSVTARIEGNSYTTQLSARHHSLIADEPTEEGGQDRGFMPDELLASALASCTAITLRMYLHRKEWPVENITVGVAIEKTIENGLTKTTFRRSLACEGELSDEQRRRLVQIADACPTHKMLKGEIHVETIPR